MEKGKGEKGGKGERGGTYLERMLGLGGYCFNVSERLLVFLIYRFKLQTSTSHILPPTSPPLHLSLHSSNPHPTSPLPSTAKYPHLPHPNTTHPPTPKKVLKKKNQKNSLRKIHINTSRHNPIIPSINPIPPIIRRSPLHIA